MNRAVDLSEGRLYVVSDLHGEWEPYQRYRDHFLNLHQAGDADRLVFLGDVIHGYGEAENDYSLAMLWDIMQLQAELGSDRVIMLLGNHELPHIYSITLSKGKLQFTPRFEHALGEYREPVIEFLHTLPFMIRTRAGVMMLHAGAAVQTASSQAAAQLLSYSHESLLQEADRLLARDDVMTLVGQTLGVDLERYDQLAWENLAVTGRDDPRYTDLLRGFIASSLEPEWSTLWAFFFTQCEREAAAIQYDRVLERFLSVYSTPEMPQTAMVTGHIAVQGGKQVIAKKQLRLASWAHAQPNHAGCYLLFDAGQRINSADDLLRYVYPMP